MAASLWVVAEVFLFAKFVDALHVHQHQSQKDDRPNIVWILADDLHYEAALVENMPNLRRMRNEGLEFPNHVSQSPLCGPSRASLLVGRLPHNSGYKNNAADESVEAFAKLHDNSVGKWLTDAGYYTAFLGKYVNGLINDPKVSPKGWRYFGGFTGEWDKFKNQWLGGTYSYYNASQWDLHYDETGTTLLKMDNSDYPINIHTGVHQADFLGDQTIEQASKAVALGKPFFIFTNPAMIHHGYCEGPFTDESQYAADDPWNEEFKLKVAISPCTKKDRPEAFLNTKLGQWRMHERTKAWNYSGIGGWKHYGDCCSSEDVVRMQYGAANRTGSMVDLDDMLGFILDGLTKLKVLDNTYVFFTSDNGFHLGEHNFMYGKTLPYDHDVRVPLVIRPPKGVPTGVRYLPTSHVDITRTIADLANAESKVTPSLAAVDGRSFASAFKGDVSVKDWRRFSYSEMFEGQGKTWRNIRYIAESGHVEWTLSWWCSGEIELFHVMSDDKDQLFNVLAPEAGAKSNKWGQDILDQYLPVLNSLGACVGEDCSTTASKSLGGKDPSELLQCSEAMSRGVER